MNTLDILILVAMGAGVVHGFSTGMIRQIASVVGMVLAFILSARFMGPVGDVAFNTFGLSESVSPLVGFVLVFLVVQIAVFALAKMAESLIGALKLTTVNRALGGGLGAIKAALALSVLFLVLDYANIPGETLTNESSLYTPVAGLFPKAWDYASERWPQVESLSQKFGKEIESRVPNIGS